MKLFEYKNEDGTTDIRTQYGTVIPADVLEEWKQISIRSKQRCQELDQFIADLQNIIDGNK